MKKFRFYRYSPNETENYEIALRLKKNFQCANWDYCFETDCIGKPKKSFVITPSSDHRLEWSLEVCLNTLNKPLEVGNPLQMEALRVLNYFNIIYNLEGKEHFSQRVQEQIEFEG